MIFFPLAEVLFSVFSRPDSFYFETARVLSPLSFLSSRVASVWLQARWLLPYDPGQSGAIVVVLASEIIISLILFLSL